MPLPLFVVHHKRIGYNMGSAAATCVARGSRLQVVDTINQDIANGKDSKVRFTVPGHSRRHMYILGVLSGRWATLKRRKKPALRLVARCAPLLLAPP